jgi:hypothetical protein
MKIALLLSATLALASYASAQSPVTAVAGNNQIQVNKPVTNAPSQAKPPSKPAPPPVKKPSPAPTPAPAKPSTSLSSSNSNQNQSANSNANANGNTNTNTAAGGKGGSSTSIAAGGSASGGNAKGGSASSGSDANGTNSVDASDHAVSNTNVHELFIPPVVPPTPPSSLAVGNVVVETSACGPLQRVIKEPVNGTFYGLFKNSKTPLGFTEELAPYVDQNGDVQEYKKVLNDDGYVLFGHQVTTYTAILGVSAARSSAVGGGAGSGAWGQAGLGTTSSNQRLVTNIILRSCEIGTVRREIETAKAEPLPDATVTYGGVPTYGTQYPTGSITLTGDPAVIFPPTPRKAVRSHRKPKHHDPACVTLSVR